jgi:hypothetical protein
MQGTNVHRGTQSTNDIASNSAASDTGAAASQVLSATGKLSK